MVVDTKDIPSKTYARGKHPNTLANLTKRNRFKKGEPSANPFGAPPSKTHLRTYVRQFMDLDIDEFRRQVSYKGAWKLSKVIAYGYVAKLLRDTVRAGDEGDAWKRIKEEFDRDEGQPDQTITIIAPEFANMSDGELNEFLRQAAKKVGRN